MKRLLFLLCLPILAAEPPAALKVHLVASSLLERDPWSKGDWAPFRTQQVEWDFRLSFEPAKGGKAALEAVVEGFRGRWMDRLQEDPKAPGLDCAFAPASEGKAPDPWAKALQSVSGTKLRIELGPKGGVFKVEGMTSASAKFLGALPQDKASKALAREMQAWFTDEAWTRLLGSASLPPEGSKTSWLWPLPWPSDFEEKPLSKAPIEFKASADGGDSRVSGTLDAGKVDETLQFPLQPGYHSLGTEQTGKLSALYGPQGLKTASVEAAATDRWDNYRQNSKADRFTRTASMKLTLEALP